MSPLPFLVAAVKEYALQKYNEGWDIVVECLTDEDIERLIDGANTVQGAKRKVSALYVRPTNNIRKEQEACAF